MNEDRKIKSKKTLRVQQQVAKETDKMNPQSVQIRLYYFYFFRRVVL